MASERNIRFTAESVERGDRMVKAQVAHCSEPGCAHKLAVFNQKGSRIIPPALFGRVLRKNGWSVRHGTDPFCPDHGDKPQVEIKMARPSVRPHAVKQMTIILPPSEPTLELEPPMPTATPLVRLEQLGEATARQMTLDQRRRINREIGDSWDGDKSRYIGDESDQKIAVRLSFPRAWVEQVRVENFGDSGANDEIEEFKALLDAKLKEWDVIVAQASSLVDKAVEAVGKLEALRTEVKQQRQRLERIEVAVLPRRA